PGARPLAAPEMVERTRRAEKKQRFGVDRAEEQRERIGRQQPQRRTGPLFVELLARQQVHVGERAEERAERYDRRPQEERRFAAAEQQRHHTNEERVRRKKDDVLLFGGARAMDVRVAVNGDLQVPAGVPSQRQIEQLVVEVAIRRRARAPADQEDR